MPLASRLAARLPRDPVRRGACLAAAAVVLAALAVAGLAVAASLIDTGAFVIDAAPAPGRAEQPSPYFHLAVGALLAGLAGAALCGAFIVAAPRIARWS